MARPRSEFHYPEQLSSRGTLLDDFKGAPKDEV
jgi:hypothetical protein